ncbi:MAG: prepilin-type N-terminal cleavage/methylation domain-containing protein [Chitinivibrionales bacterium]|nr:prepilin-type N-terminal cleavage/methylation domain-containing protein [Chitinivibrionales bacterium]
MRELCTRKTRQEDAPAGNSGFTLVEIIIAMFVLTTIVICLNTYMLSFVRSNVSSRETSAATAEGNRILENIRMMNYEDIVSDSETAKEKYYCVWTVTTETDKKTIDVTVAWPPATMRHSVKLSTIISKP